MNVRLNDFGAYMRAAVKAWRRSELNSRFREVARRNNGQDFITAPNFSDHSGQN